MVSGPVDISFPYNSDTCYEELKGEKGLFATKEFPEDYAENSNCTWKIIAPENHKIQLTFHLLNVSSYLFY